jgi:hypothetical protein
VPGRSVVQTGRYATLGYSWAMFRRTITALIAAALLLQAGLGFAQPRLAPHEPDVRVERTDAMPCHGATAKAEVDKVTAKSCCDGDDCRCAHACSGVSALPTPAADLEDFIAAHFEALRAPSDPVPAYARQPLKPPTTPHS